MEGLRRSLGNETFDSFMGVHGGVSLIFVIDDTASMSEEIQAAKDIAIKIIRKARRNPISNYILSPFNDPYPAGKYSKKSKLQNNMHVIFPLPQSLLSYKDS